MPRERRNFSGAEKMAILREHLIEKVPISEVCEKHGVQPTLFYQWQRRLFEEGAAVFEQPDPLGRQTPLQTGDDEVPEGLTSADGTGIPGGQVWYSLRVLPHFW